MIDTASADGIRRLTLDRPDRRNALDDAGLAALSEAVAAATEPVVLIQGAGDAFCAGADLETVRDLDDGAAAETFARRGQALARQLASYNGAVVAGIDGAARGGGVELALACDCRVCTAEATIAEPGVGLGLFGAWGGTARLPAVVGPTAAADLSLSGRTIDAEAAREIGLVSRIVDDPATVAAEIAAGDDAAVRALGGLIGPAVPEDWLAAQERRERTAFAALVETGRPLRKD